MSSEIRKQEVTLTQMLDVRERRACHQRELLMQYQKPLLCFTMNIAGPVKNSHLIRRGFQAGLSDVKLQLQRVKSEILYQEVWSEVTGNEAFLVVDMDGYTLKSFVCELEDADALGRLYDMDVLLPSPDEPLFPPKIDRTDLGKPARTCLICGGPAKECASRRLHSLEDLQRKTKQILDQSLKERDASRIAELAVRSLLYEVSVTPKPGLVDRFDNGSHKDMDFYSFLNSASALWPYFYECACLGLEYADSPEPSLPELFTSLRQPGKFAENRMLHATDGVNTHKGAIFSMGILCAAIGAVLPEHRAEPEMILHTCAAMTVGLTASDYCHLTEKTAITAGQRFYLQYGITGVRGEIEAGLPVVAQYGLPLLEKLLAEGKGVDEAGSAVLLTIMAHMTDTNLIARSDLSTQKQTAELAEDVLNRTGCPSRDTLDLMNQEFVKKNLSPGGSADMLAICWMLHFISQELLLL